MSGVYFTADLHLGHRAIVDHCHRPFHSVEIMDSVLIANINLTVAKADRLYILGDFSLGNFATVAAQRQLIACRSIYLIRGNHDRLSAKQYEEAGFIFKGDICDLKVDDQHVTLCHYAMRRWNGSHHGAWHLFGHSHGHLPDDPSLFAFDVGVDCHRFFPLSFDEVQALMLSRTEAKSEANHAALSASPNEGGSSEPTAENPATEEKEERND